MEEWKRHWLEWVLVWLNAGAAVLDLCLGCVTAALVQSAFAAMWLYIVKLHRKIEELED